MFVASVTPIVCGTKRRKNAQQLAVWGAQQRSVSLVATVAIATCRVQSTDGILE
jgi:hypothetical protein